MGNYHHRDRLGEKEQGKFLKLALKFGARIIRMHVRLS